MKEATMFDFEWPLLVIDAISLFVVFIAELFDPAQKPLPGLVFSDINDVLLGTPELADRLISLGIF
jgi:hypothetical protein